MRKNDYRMEEKQLSDEKIIALYWERNESAIKATDEKYGTYLFTIAYNILRNDWDCEECINDTYLHTWNRIPPTKPNIFQVFLSKITRDLAVDKYRKSKANKRIPSELISSLEELGDCLVYSPSIEEEYAVKELIRVLNSYLSGLSKRDKFIFVCRYYYADSVTYIAQMLEVSHQTVYRRLAKIRCELHEALEKEGISV